MFEALQLNETPDASPRGSSLTGKTDSLTLRVLFGFKETSFREVRNLESCSQPRCSQVRPQGLFSSLPSQGSGTALTQVGGSSKPFETESDNHVIEGPSFSLPRAFDDSCKVRFFMSLFLEN